MSLSDDPTFDGKEYLSNTIKVVMQAALLCSKRILLETSMQDRRERGWCCEDLPLLELVIPSLITTMMHTMLGAVHEHEHFGNSVEDTRNEIESVLKQCLQSAWDEWESGHATKH